METALIGIWSTPICVYNIPNWEALIGMWSTPNCVYHNIPNWEALVGIWNTPTWVSTIGVYNIPNWEALIGIWNTPTWVNTSIGVYNIPNWENALIGICNTCTLVNTSIGVWNIDNWYDAFISTIIWSVPTWVNSFIGEWNMPTLVNASIGVWNILTGTWENVFIGVCNVNFGGNKPYKHCVPTVGMCNCNWCWMYKGGHKVCTIPYKVIEAYINDNDKQVRKDLDSKLFQFVHYVLSTDDEKYADDTHLLVNLPPSIIVEYMPVSTGRWMAAAHGYQIGSRTTLSTLKTLFEHHKCVSCETYITVLAIKPSLKEHQREKRKNLAMTNDEK